jgi:hypothetical protein
MTYCRSRILNTGTVLLFLFVNPVIGGCETINKEKSCYGTCTWNFVGECCYQTGKDNCYNSLAMITTQPSIDSKTTIGVPNPSTGSTEQPAGTVTTVPLENNPPPAFVPGSSVNGGGSVDKTGLMSNGGSVGMMTNGGGEGAGQVESPQSSVLGGGPGLPKMLRRR